MCWRCLSVPVISNVMASLISSTVIKFLAVIANGGGFVISPFLLIWGATKLGWLCALFVGKAFNNGIYTLAPVSLISTVNSVIFGTVFCCLGRLVSVNFLGKPNALSVVWFLNVCHYLHHRVYSAWKAHSFPLIRHRVITIAISGY